MKAGRKMKGYELIKEISERKIKNNTIIEVRMGNEYKATLKYERFMLKWQTGEFDTSVLCSPEADFKVIEETKRIEELGMLTQEIKGCDGKEYTELKPASVIDIHNKINELVRAVNKLNKEREEK